MIIKSSTALCRDYNGISKLAHETGEPLCITKDGEKDLIPMSIEAFEKLQSLLDLLDKLTAAEEQRLSGALTVSLETVHQGLKEKLSR